MKAPTWGLLLLLALTPPARFLSRAEPTTTDIEKPPRCQPGAFSIR